MKLLITSTILLAICTLAPLHSSAKSQFPKNQRSGNPKEPPSMLLTPGIISLACDFARSNNNNGTKRTGFAPGIQVNYFEGWGLQENAHKGFDGGGYARIHCGYGKLKDKANSGSSKNWIPYDFSIGAVGSYSINKNHEIGIDYGIIGIYGFSTYAYFGSQITLKYRFWKFQTEYTHGGDGIFRGAFVPRFNSGASHAGTLYYLVSNDIYIGGRYAKIPDGGNNIKRYTTEFRIIGGLYFSRGNY